MYGHRTLRRLLTDESGQDLIEYGLLCAFIGFAGLATFSGMGVTLQVAYDSWTAAADTAVEMPDPIP